MIPTKILVLKGGDIHPTIETAVCFDTEFVTMSGLRFDLDAVLKVGDTIDDGEYQIFSIESDTIDVLALADGNRHTVPLEKIEWCDLCKDFHVYLDEDDVDDIDEYTSGYTDAIRDCVEYLMDSSTSTIRKTLKKMNLNYLSDVDSDEAVAEFVSKRFEKKPQLTLDELKEIVGYDFDLV